MNARFQSLRTMLGFALIALFAVSAHAQVQVERQLPAPANGELHIHNPFGKLTIRGWDKQEVLVRGVLAAGAEDFDFDVDEDGVDVEVEVPESWFYSQDEDTKFRSVLEIFVPKSYGLSAETTNAEIDVEGLNGEWEIETINGAIRGGGSPEHIVVETVTGAVTLLVDDVHMHVETISGDVTITGATDELEVQTVSGAVDIKGREMKALHVKSTTGPINLAVTPAKKCEFQIESFSGALDLDFRGTKAQFEIQSFSGKIESDAGPSPTRDKREGPYEQLRFNTGLDDCEVEATTHSGDITLRVGMAQ